MSQKIRKRIEEGFGWIKTVGGQRKTRFRGRDKVGWACAFTAAALQPRPPAQAARSSGVSVLGKWRIVEPGYADDYADMVEPAYILFFEATGGEFAFGCVTGAFAGGGDHAAVKFDWNGNDEMDEARGSGWAEIKADGSLRGEIGFHAGDDIPFSARRWPSSSTAC